MIKILQKKFFPHDQKKAHLKYLDGLRGLAIMIVVVAHGSDFGLNLHPVLNFMAPTGSLGVFIFFLLSSYLLDRNIVQVLINKKANTKYWLNYALRRFLRIYPLFIISLFFYYFLNRKYLGTFISRYQDIVDHVLLREGIHFYWSISVEFIYYLVSPLILIFCDKVLKWDFKKVLLFLSSLIMLSVAVEFYTADVRFATINYLPIFLIGTVIAVTEINSTIFVKKIKLNWDIVGVAAITIVIFTQIFRHSSWYANLSGAYSINLFLPYGIFIGGVLLSVNNKAKFLRRLFEMKFLRFFGTISFSLYLFHWAVILFIEKYGFKVVWLDTVLYYFISTIIASVTYLILEFPLSKITIKNFITKDNKKTLIKPLHPIEEEA